MPHESPAPMPMSSRCTPRCRAAAALAWLLGAAIVPAASAAGPDRGQLLYDTHCIACHTTQMHWRDNRKVQDWAGLLAQVHQWQARARLDWSDEDVQAVARHLNERIYRLPAPEQRAALDPAR